MRAVRIKKRGHGNPGFTVHWLTDADGTRCGLDTDTLNIAEELDVERLPLVEGCRGCARIAGELPSRERDWPEPYWANNHALPASHGRLSTTGPLSHTGRSSTRGRALRP